MTRVSFNALGLCGTKESKKIFLSQLSMESISLIRFSTDPMTSNEVDTSNVKAFVAGVSDGALV